MGDLLEIKLTNQSVTQIIMFKDRKNNRKIIRIFMEEMS